MASWSPQQDHALTSVAEWLASPSGKQVFRLFGYAGTGKTTLARHFAENVKGDVVFGAYTGKAALVLRSKGCKGASTLHSLLYVPEEGYGGAPSFVLNRDSAVRSAALVIVDEVSMVDEEIGRDLLSFGRPVLVLGDPAQLPPVKGGGFFTSHEPDVMLSEVHRQAAENPIIAMSKAVREGRKLAEGRFGDSAVIRRDDVVAKDVLAADQVLVGMNKSRRNYNRRIRDLLGRRHQSTPQDGDRLVCLRNNHPKGLLNGGIWSVQKCEDSKIVENAFDMVLKPEDAGVKDRHVSVTTPRNFFEGTEDALPWSERRKIDEFDFAYALTCHKSPGSQWGNVMVFDESAAFREQSSRWLYTAITRAADKVTVVQMAGAR